MPEAYQRLILYQSQHFYIKNPPCIHIVFALSILDFFAMCIIVLIAAFLLNNSF